MSTVTVLYQELTSKAMAFCVILLFVLCNVSCTKVEVWNVSDYGALGDSITINTVAIQTAIDACALAGGGRVLVENGNYISGTILLKNKVDLHIAENAKILGSPNPLDYISIDPFVDATGQQRGKCLIGALDANNIAITGAGIIDGRGRLFEHGMLKNMLHDKGIEGKEAAALIGDRPFLIRLVRSENIILKNVHLRQPAAWTLHFFQSANILVDNISIYSHAHRNNDGIDLDSSHDVIIKNCNIDTGDDALCFKTTSAVPTHSVVASHCTLKSDWGAIKFGTESMGDFYDITVKDCVVNDTKGGGIKLLSMDGANISNITVENITMNNVDMPIFVRLGERLRTYRNDEVLDVGSIDGVTFNNIKATTRGLNESRVSPPSGILITGTPDYRIGQLTLTNIDIQLPGGGETEHRDIELEEDKARYPEFSFFGISPTYGIYARHVESLTTENVNFDLQANDARDAQQFIDVTK